MTLPDRDGDLPEIPEGGVTLSPPRQEPEIAPLPPEAEYADRYTTEAGERVADVIAAKAEAAGEVRRTRTEDEGLDTAVQRFTPAPPRSPALVPATPTGDVDADVKVLSDLAVRFGMATTGGFVKALAAVMQTMPAPATAWEIEVTEDGTTIFGLWEQMPGEMRGRLETGWSAFAEAARHLFPRDLPVMEKLLESPERMTWLQEFLEEGPWNEDEEASDPEERAREKRVSDAMEKHRRALVDLTNAVRALREDVADLKGDLKETRETARELIEAIDDAMEESEDE